MTSIRFAFIKRSEEKIFSIQSNKEQIIMSTGQGYGQQFNRADVNHDGTIDEGEFRQFLGPVIRDERRLSGSLTPQDIQHFNVCLFLSLISSLLLC